MNADAGRTMNAWVKHGPQTDGIDLVRVPVPGIDDRELLVKIEAVGVGVHDGYFFPQDITYPFPIGIEAAGVVETAGSTVTDYHPGDRIAFVSSLQPKGGTWAEFAVVASDSLILRIPDGLGFATAAAVPVAGNTILRAMQPLTIAADGWLFVAGGSGAIGTLAIQLARRRGWQVAASASRQNHEYMMSLGATVVVDYHDADWPEQLLRRIPSGVDAAIAIQPGTGVESLGVVRDGGHVITISGDQPASRRGIRVQPVPFPGDVRDQLQELLDDIARGDVQLVIEEVHSFENGDAALRKVQTRHARGKTVLTL